MTKQTKETPTTAELSQRLAKAIDQQNKLIEGGEGEPGAAAATATVTPPAHDRTKRIKPDPGQAALNRGKQTSASAPAFLKDGLGDRPFSFVRLTRAIKNKDFSEAGLEREIHNQMIKAGCEPEEDGFLVPLDCKTLEEIYPQLKGVRELMTKGYTPSPSMRKRLELSRGKVLTSGDAALGGALVDAEAEIIDLLRAQVVMERAGAQVLTFPKKGKLTLPKQTSDPTAEYVGENEDATPLESDPGTGEVEFTAKTLGAWVRTSNQLLARSTPDAERWIREGMATQIALKEDLTFLRAVGSSKVPTGIANWADIGSYTLIADVASGGNGGRVAAEDIFNIVDQVEDNNGIFEGWIFRSALRNTIRQLRSDAVAEGDGKGNFLYVNNLVENIPGELVGYPTYISNQIPRNLVKGSGTGLTEIYAGMFSRTVIVRGATLEIRATQDGEGTFKKNQTLFRALLENDFGVLTENVIVFAEGAKTN